MSVIKPALQYLCCCSSLFSKPITYLAVQTSSQLSFGMCCPVIDGWVERSGCWLLSTAFRTRSCVMGATYACFNARLIQRYRAFLHISRGANHNHKDTRILRGHSHSEQDEHVRQITAFTGFQHSEHFPLLSDQTHVKLGKTWHFSMSNWCGLEFYCERDNLTYILSLYFQWISNQWNASSSYHSQITLNSNSSSNTKWLWERNVRSLQSQRYISHCLVPISN